MPGVAVLMPWSGSCPHRLAAKDYVQRWYRRYYPAWDVVEGWVPSDAVWCKGQAVAHALARTSATTLVVADADAVAPRVGLAVRAVRNAVAWAIPHTTVRRLTPAATAHVLNTRMAKSMLDCDDTSCERPAYSATPGGGVTVLRRDTYLDAPLDHRFGGWGQEDGAWGTALRCLFGKPWRPYNAPLWHLWHPPQRRLATATGALSVGDLRQRYRMARTKASMDTLLSECRAYVREATC